MYVRVSTDEQKRQGYFLIEQEEHLQQNKGNKKEMIKIDHLFKGK